MRRRLTAEEREIRRSRGIGFSRWWPFAVPFIGLMVASADLPLLQRCIGSTIEIDGRAGAALRSLAASVCSPLLVLGSASEWLLFAIIWLPIPFAVVSWRWTKRHRAYWDGIRARERERRADKRLAKMERSQAASDNI
jgi:hypothetical protein